VITAGEVPFRMGNAHPSVFPYEPLPTADGDLIVTAGNDRQFRILCGVLGVPHVADDPLYATNAARTANREELRPLLVQRLAARGKQEWFEELISAGVPCGPINTVDQGIAFAESLGLAPVIQVGEPGATRASIRNPITFSATPARYTAAPPQLDADGDAVRAWLAAPFERPAPPDRAAQPEKGDTP
jgi:crotonobetainyl-CoA:carnitine CoA-transferase CaiB-like acyl-CoA transferase